MADDPGDITVIDNGDEQRFEIRVDGDRVGQAEYLTDDVKIVFTHTEIDPEVGRSGLGGRLVRYALETARRRGLIVVPRCPFVASYITKHPEFLDLVDEPERARLSA